MNPWLRLVALAIVVIVAALLLKVLPPFVVLIGFIGGVAYVNHRLKAGAKREARRDDVTILGLKRSEEDPFGLLGYPLALFSRGSEPRIEELSWGSWRGLDVRRFDVTFEHPIGGPEAERPRFACAIAPLRASVPPLVIEPVGFVTRLASEAAMPQRPTGFESVDRALVVRCEAPAFVGELVDERMAGWLSTLGDDLGVEVSGSLAMLYGPAESGGDVVVALETLQGFLEHVPAEVAARRPITPTPPNTSVGP